jgi:pimeloyl-ACP methyl ester carboxylesterase
MLGGLILALVLTLLVFGGAKEPVINGVALLAFALGWATLAWLSTKRTDQPQRWAFVPAIVMGVLGLAHLVLQPSDDVLSAVGWVWPIPVAALTIWMIVQSRRSLRNWSRRAILYPVLGVLLLAAIGGGYQTIRDAQDSAKFTSAGGQLIDVGGHKLYISCTGSGSPTVILEAGLGEPAAMMAGWVQPGVAASTKVCVYDRAGEGWSELADTPQDGLAIASDLHTLLSRAEVDPPYVLVAHSSGGPYVEVYAARYPADVAGMVLLDAQPVDAFANLPGYAAEYKYGIRAAAGLTPAVARLGVMRLIYSSAVPGLPARERAEVRAFWSTSTYSRAFRDEVAGLRDALTQAQALTSLGDKPLVVVTAVKNAHKGWLPLQDEMIHLSTNSVHRVIQDATHTSLIEDQGDAANSIKAILDVVASVRSGAQLR